MFDYHILYQTISYCRYWVIGPPLPLAAAGRAVGWKGAGRRGLRGLRREIIESNGIK